MTREQEIRDRLAKATPGPWHTEDNAQRVVYMAQGYWWSAAHIPHGSAPQQKPDATFIANAPSDLAYCLSLIAEQDEIIQRSAKVIKELQDHYAAERERAEALSRRVAELETAIYEIAKQRVSDELTHEEYKHSDFIGGFDACVQTARAALPPIPNRPVDPAYQALKPQQGADRG